MSGGAIRCRLSGSLLLLKSHGFYCKASNKKAASMHFSSSRNILARHHWCEADLSFFSFTIFSSPAENSFFTTHDHFDQRTR